MVSCIDSRTPAELLFDLGVGDMFSVRVAGNITSRKVMGSVEYACNVAGAKLILVLGHTRCGAVTAAVNLASAPGNHPERHGLRASRVHLAGHSKIGRPDRLSKISRIFRPRRKKSSSITWRGGMSRAGGRGNPPGEAPTLNELVQNGRVAIVGTIYDVATGNLEFLPTAGSNNLQAMSTA